MKGFPKAIEITATTQSSNQKEEEGKLAMREHPEIYHSTRP
jgi:hypothetical protein